MEAVQNGNKLALEELMWRMRPLVMNLANKYSYGTGSLTHERYSKEQWQEIQQEAWAGLMDAVERYDPKHPAGKPFWTVAGYRITHHIKEWQGAHSGSLRLPREAWRQAWHIDKTLEAEGMEEWEQYTDVELAAITGVHSAGPILRARTEGFTLFDDDQDNHRRHQSAEDEFWEAQEASLASDLLDWLEGLENVPEGLWEDAVYHKLVQLDLDGEVEAADLLRQREALLEQRRRHEAST